MNKNKEMILSNGDPMHVNHGDTILTVGDKNSFIYTIKDPVGLHARPAGALVKLVKQYKSAVSLSTGDKTVNAGNIMAVMSLGATNGMKVRIEATGEDSSEALTALREFFCAEL